EARALHLALRAGEPARVAHALAMEAAFLTAAGPSAAPAADKVLDAAEAIALRVGSTQSRGSVVSGRAFSHFNRGSFRSSLDLADRAVAVLREQPVGVFW